MSTATADEQRSDRWRWWEDLADAGPEVVGPLRVEAVALETHVAVTGESHPLHTLRHGWPPGRHTAAVVPGALLHSVVSGAFAAGRAPLAVAGLRSMRWTFPRALHVGEEFEVHCVYDHARPVDAGVGVVTSRRRVVCGGLTTAIGVLELAVYRRPPGAAS